MARAVAVGVVVGNGDALAGVEALGLGDGVAGALDGGAVGATGVAVAGVAVAGGLLGVGAGEVGSGRGRDELRADEEGDDERRGDGPDRAERRPAPALAAAAMGWPGNTAGMARGLGVQGSRRARPQVARRDRRPQREKLG